MVKKLLNMAYTNSEIAQRDIFINIEKTCYNENVIVDIVESTFEVISKIIKAISEFVVSIINIFTGKSYISEFKKLDELHDMVIKNPSISTKKVPLILEESYQDMVNEYFRELSEIKRKYIVIKYKTAKDTAKPFDYIFLKDELENELKHLEERYDKKLIEASKNVVNVALADAIRYNEKQLKNIKINFKKYQDGSTKILEEYRRDLNGTFKKDPIVAGIFSTITSTIGTRIRKIAYNGAKSRHRNLESTVFLGLGTKGYTFYNKYNAIKSLDVASRYI